MMINHLLANACVRAWLRDDGVILHRPVVKIFAYEDEAWELSMLRYIHSGVGQWQLLTPKGIRAAKKLGAKL